MLQDTLQTKYTGGTVLHVFLGEQVNDLEAIKGLIQKIAMNFRLPYFTLTPTFSVCPSHGYIKGEQKKCYTCSQETEVYSGVIEDRKPIRKGNGRKKTEFGAKKTFQVA